VSLIYELLYSVAYKDSPRHTANMPILLLKRKNSKLGLDSAYRIKISKPFKRLILLDINC